MRPASRSGGNVRPSSSGVNLGTAPGAIRPGSGLRPGSGMRSGTGMRIGTAGMGTRIGSVGSGVDVQITSRPMTQQGLGGMRAATAGPGRQIIDSSYLIGVIRAKSNEISSEISRMRSEMEKATRNSSLSLQLEKTYAALVKEVRSLEGDLADVNLAQDKLRSGVDQSDLVAMCLGIKRKNEMLSQEVDSLLVERQERLQGVQRLQEQIGNIKKAVQTRMESLSPQEKADYERCLKEKEESQAEIERLQSELEGLNLQIEASEKILYKDGIQDEYALAEKKLELLKREIAALEADKELISGDPTVARDRLLQKVKEDNARMSEVEKRIKEVDEEILKRRQYSDELSKEMNERKGEVGDPVKYEALFKRDAEVTEFVDRYPQMREKELAEHRKLQESIVSLLEHISEGMEREKSMPTKDAAIAMQSELKDKQQELVTSEQTMERLEAELSNRRIELGKLDTLEEKISQELKMIEEKQQRMREEMLRYNDIDGLRRTFEASREELIHYINSYSKKLDALRQQGPGTHTKQLSKLAEALASDSEARKIQELEGKIKELEASVFEIQEFIATVGRSCDYDSVREECRKLTTELHLVLSRNLDLT